MKTLLVIPARNEEKSIGAVLERIAELYPHLPVLIVDDASNDCTCEVVRRFAQFTLLRLPFWMGYGGALQAAYKYAWRNDFDAVIQLDADGQHDPHSIHDLFARIDQADVVVGSRFLGTGDYKMPFVRRFGCRFLSWLGVRLTGMKITDPTSGYQALNRKALSIAIQDHYPMDYPDLDVLILMHRFRLRVIEVPVSMHVSTDKAGMHEGLQVWYYAFKMILSIFVVMLRRL